MYIYIYILPYGYICNVHRYISYSMYIDRCKMVVSQNTGAHGCPKPLFHSSRYNAWAAATWKCLTMRCPFLPCK